MQTLMNKGSGGSSSYGGRERRLKCLYTTQLTKKRKTWSDGLLKVFYSGGSFQCSLLDCGKFRETILVSRQLESMEVQQLKKNEEVELDFEGYLVSVCASISVQEESKVGPPLKLPKFVPPSKYVPPTRQVEQFRNSANISGNTTAAARPVNGTGPYKVTNDELDDIWDRDQPLPTRRNASEYAPADMEPPAFLTFSKERPESAVEQGKSHFRSVQPAPKLSVGETLRQMGANARGDASQPALTRYFAAAPPPPSRPSAATQEQAPSNVTPPVGYCNEPPAVSANIPNTVIGRDHYNSLHGRVPAASISVTRQPVQQIHTERDSYTGRPHSFGVPAVPFQPSKGMGQTCFRSSGFASSATVLGFGQPSKSVAKENDCTTNTQAYPLSDVRGDGLSQRPVKASYSTIISSSVWDSD